ncbi:hypothetical protein [Trichlorobacter lovleyi]|jgi:hypothetical protein|uniref:Uncharacterized protein n=1 Tax=Trichlorobacter lovleyi (strain ATCC BAA-1151 / DSM 17278 / SZ) TaxID=398767 RepID=B3E6M1_TRIL1|nr:hypothetical protein [Trichlorobacter lovleyi]ACD94846.1 hypothetical protein Glov_1124 [Trichlorobacter lovleyi SZ]
MAQKATKPQQASPLPASEDNSVADHHYSKLQELHYELEETTGALGAYYYALDELRTYSEDSANQIFKLIINDLVSITDDIHRHLNDLTPVRHCAPHALRPSEKWEKLYIGQISNLRKGGEQ